MFVQLRPRDDYISIIVASLDSWTTINKMKINYSDQGNDPGSSYKAATLASF